MIIKIIIAFLIAATIAVIDCSLYALIHSKQKWLIAIISTVCIAILSSCILELLGITNLIIEYLAKVEWVSITVAIWVFTIAIVLDKSEKEGKEKEEKEKEEKKQEDKK